MAAGVEWRDEPEDGAPGRCRRGTEPEAQRRDHIRIDPQQLRGHRVLYRRTNRPPKFGPVQYQIQDAEHRQGNQEGEEANHVHLISQHRPTEVLIAGLDRPVGGVVDDGKQTLETERNGEGDEQGEFCGIIRAQHPQKRPLDRDPEGEQERGRDQDRQEGIHPGEGEQAVGQIGGQHHEGRLGQVDDLHDPENQCLTAGHQGVDATGQDTEDDGLDQGMDGPRHQIAFSIRPSWASAPGAGAARRSPETRW